MDITVKLAVILLVCCCLSDGCSRSKRKRTYVTRSYRRYTTPEPNAVEAILSSYNKRSIEVDVPLKADPCSFNTYDINEDGGIEKEELFAIIGNNEKTNILFSELDIQTADGVVNLDEFSTAASWLFNGCEKK